MAVIRPLKGLRFSSTAGPIDSLTAPPYDVLSPAQRNDYAVRSPYNVVHLTLPEQEVDDRSKYVKYARSAARLAEWRRDAVLLPEPDAAIYRYTQSFNVHRHGEVYTRTSIIALIKVEPYEKGVVLPHEQTFPKHKEDRLRILEATRSHLECIFGLFEDPDGAVLDTIRNAPVGARVEAQSQDGVLHHLEPITDENAIRQIVAGMDPKKVWIADGHHRYETAVTFRSMQGEHDGLIAEDFMMMALSSMSDPGLVLLPTHRIVNVLPISTSEAISKLSTVFDMQEAHSTRLAETMSKPEPSGRRQFGLALEGGIGYVLTVKDEDQLMRLVDNDESEALRNLDVSILHTVILEHLLGVKGLDAIAYTRDSHEAIRAADEGAAAAFLMHPPSVEDMKQIALGGGKMPQKSTYYFPKILSGLVIWSLNDFE